MCRKSLVESETLDTQRIVANQWVSYDRRFYMADAEDLAEGSVCGQLAEMKTVLRRERVKLSSLIDELDVLNDCYHVVVNGERHKVYGADREKYTSWGLAHRKTIEILNELLVAAHSKERAYALYGGNEAQIVLLDETLYQYILTLPFGQEAGLRGPKEMDSE